MDTAIPGPGATTSHECQTQVHLQRTMDDEDDDSPGLDYAVRGGAALWAQQVQAILTKNFLNQIRSRRSTITLFFMPVMLLVLVWGMQKLMDDQFDSRSFRCGCKCTSCCSWVPNTTGGTSIHCHEDTPEQPCRPSSQCKAYDSSRCGYQYSTPSQVGYCKVDDPPVWPPVLQVPPTHTRADSMEAADNGENMAIPLLYTGNHEEAAALIMGHLVPPRTQQLNTSANLPSLGPTGAVLLERLLLTDFCNSSQMDAERDALMLALRNSTDGLSTQSAAFSSQLSWMVSQLQLVLGSASPTTVSNFVDLSFAPRVSPAKSVARGSQSSPLSSWTTPAQDGSNQEANTLYILAADCAALPPLQQLMLRQMSCAVNSTLQLKVQCASLQPHWVGSTQLLQEQVFCGWSAAGCSFVNGTRVSLPGNKAFGSAGQQYASALYEWAFADLSNCALDQQSGVDCLLQSGMDLTVWVNSTITPPNFPPYNDRWPAAVQAAGDALLRRLTGGNWSMSLEGMKGFPYEGGHWKTDFASLMGPLFFMWILNLPLTGFTSSLVSEKAAGLQSMMFSSGLSPSAFLAATYTWQLSIYCVYMTVCGLFGAAIRLHFFTLNSALIQIVLYLLWGSVLVTYCLWTGTIYQQSQRAVLAAILTNIMSGLFANLVVQQFVQYGPSWLAQLLEVLPLFALYRGLWELSQYAVLADAAQGSGMTLQSLGDAGNGMMRVWVIMAAFTFWFGFWAWYRMQGRYLIISHGAQQWKRLKSSIRATTGRWRLSCRTQVEPATPDSAGTQGNDLSTDATPNTPCDMPDGPHAESAAQPHQQPVDVHQEWCQVDTLLKTALGALADDAAQLDMLSGESLVEAFKSGGRDAEKQRAALKRVMQESRVVVLLHEVVQMYPGQVGMLSTGQAAVKPAVSRLSLSVKCMECFALLGPNGAGKTTTLKIMQGAIQPTSGLVVVGGFDASQHPSVVRKLSGVCPQHDILWPHLTGQEHLELYGRFKGIPKAALAGCVSHILAQVKLDTVAKQAVKSYSGGMKRRLSVASALIGESLVVYLDEPATGLDPASRLALWEVLRTAKQSRALVLTTHSMSEAEALCDRVGIIVRGELQCIGKPQELMERYSNILLFVITTPPDQEEPTMQLVQHMCPSAKLVYSMVGTHKFELPKSDVNLFHIFSFLEREALIMNREAANATQLYRHSDQTSGMVTSSKRRQNTHFTYHIQDQEADRITEGHGRRSFSHHSGYAHVTDAGDVSLVEDPVMRSASVNTVLTGWHDATSQLEAQSDSDSAVSVAVEGCLGAARRGSDDVKQLPSVSGSRSGRRHASDGCSDGHSYSTSRPPGRVVVFDWGVSNTTLEQVFLNVVQQRA